MATGAGKTVVRDALRPDRKGEHGYRSDGLGRFRKYAADLLEKSDVVLAYAKNDHLGSRVQYLWNGATRRYIPDFLVRLSNGKMLVLEIKGEDSEQNRAKRSAMEMWVAAVNAKGGFGTWSSDVAYQPAQLHDVLTRRG